MRILHTSDWHLGHQFHGISRDDEYAGFLHWLTKIIKERGVDALFIAGDVFDSPNPPARVLRLWYQFLAGLRQSLPQLQVVAIGGNHDSPARLETTNPILQDTGIHIIGGVRFRDDGSPDVADMTVPLNDGKGRLAAWCMAMPYIRVADLPLTSGESQGDRLLKGARSLYEELHHFARSQRQKGQALVAMGHCLMAGGILSEWSERKIFGGNQNAFPADFFPEDLAYTALGHLHKAQLVAGRPNLRYSGSPIPLSLAERDYRHQVCLVTLEGENMGDLEILPVPRMIAIAPPIAGTLDEVAQAIEELPGQVDDETLPRPFLEIKVTLEQPKPNLRLQVEQWLEGKQARLLKLTVAYSGHGQPLRSGKPSLKELRVEDVFSQCYKRQFDGEPSSELEACFNQLLEEARSGS